jgi:hypothetical protein
MPGIRVFYFEVYQLLYKNLGKQELGIPLVPQGKVRAHGFSHNEEDFMDTSV